MIKNQFNISMNYFFKFPIKLGFFYSSILIVLSLVLSNWFFKYDMKFGGFFYSSSLVSIGRAVGIGTLTS